MSDKSSTILQRQPDLIETAASEAAAAHKDTTKILRLMTEETGQVDPLAAIIDMIEIMNKKLDAVLERLPATRRKPGSSD